MAKTLSKKELEKASGGLGDETRTTPGWYYTMTYKLNGRTRTHEDGPFMRKSDAIQDADGIKAQCRILGATGFNIDYQEVKRYS